MKRERERERGNEAGGCRVYIRARSRGRDRRIDRWPKRLHLRLPAGMYLYIQESGREEVEYL